MFSKPKKKDNVNNKISVEQSDIDSASEQRNKTIDELAKARIDNERTILGSDDAAEKIGEIVKYIDRDIGSLTFEKESVGEKKPWTIHITNEGKHAIRVPSGITKDNSKVSYLMLALINRSPKYVIEAISDKVDERVKIPDQHAGYYTSLIGLIRPRPSFNYSVTDDSTKFRAALWAKLCNQVYPDLINDISGSVIPKTIGDETPKNVLDRTWAVLGSHASSEQMKDLFRILPTVVYSCSKTYKSEIYEFLTGIKIGWSTVLHDALPHESIKVKQKGKRPYFVQQLKTFTHATSSIWVNEKEKKWLSTILSAYEFDISKWKKQWTSLSSVFQHINITFFKEQMRKAYMQSKAIHSSVLQRLGHRRDIILNEAKEMSNYGVKKQDYNEYRMTQEYFKNLTFSALKTSDVEVILPTHIIGDLSLQANNVVNAFISLYDETNDMSETRKSISVLPRPDHEVDLAAQQWTVHYLLMMDDVRQISYSAEKPQKVSFVKNIYTRLESAPSGE